MSNVVNFKRYRIEHEDGSVSYIQQARVCPPCTQDCEQGKHCRNNPRQGESVEDIEQTDWTFVASLLALFVFLWALGSIFDATGVI